MALMSAYSPGWYRHYYQSLAPVFKNRRNQAYTMVVLSLFTMSFFGFFAIRPTLKTIATLQKQIEDRSFVDQKLEEKINALIAAQEEYRRVEPYISDIYGLLPEKPEFTSLLMKLEDIATAQNSTIGNLGLSSFVVYGEGKKALAPRAPQQSSDVLAAQNSAVTPISFSVTFKGGYQNLVALLLQLVRLNRIVTIDSADFKLGDESSGSAQLTVDLQTNTYYFPLE